MVSRCGGMSVPRFGLVVGRRIFKHVTKRRIEGTGSKRLGLRGSRAPCAHHDKIEGHGQNAVRIGTSVCQFAQGCRKQGRWWSASASERDGIGFAGGAKIPQHGEAGTVPYIQPLDIYDGQCKPGSLQKAGAIPGGRERRDAGRDATAQCEFRVGQALAQRGQCGQDRHAGQQQAIRFERMADLQQGAGQIVHPVQGEIGHHEVEGSRSEWQKFLVGAYAGRRGLLRETGRKVAAYDIHATLPQTPGRGAATADIERARKRPRDVVQPFQKAVGSLFQNAAYAAEQGGSAVAMLSDGAAVEGDMVVLHDIGMCAVMSLLPRGGMTAGGIVSAEMRRILRIMWPAQELKRVARTAGLFCLDMVLPPSCAVCGTEVDRAGSLCPACFGRMHAISAPRCDACGVPLPAAAHLGREGLCARCERHPPAWARGRAAYVYDEGSRDLVLALKYADRTENAAVLARQMVRAGNDILAVADVLVPVPVHWRRLFQRRYNQAALLARAIGRESGMPVLVDALRRARATSRLAAFSAAERAREMEGAVGVTPSRALRIREQNIVLVDDILTTGATAGACTRALLDAGAASVALLAAARTAPRQEEDIESPVWATD